MSSVLLELSMVREKLPLTNVLCSTPILEPEFLHLFEMKYVRMVTLRTCSPARGGSARREFTCSPLQANPERISCVCVQVGGPAGSLFCSRVYPDVSHSQVCLPGPNVV